jgi:hypothetical protein
MVIFHSYVSLPEGTIYHHRNLWLKGFPNKPLYFHQPMSLGVEPTCQISTSPEGWNQLSMENLIQNTSDHRLIHSYPVKIMAYPIIPNKYQQLPGSITPKRPLFSNLFIIAKILTR